MTSDISRASFRPAQRYSGVRWQQGRTPLDSEVNESEILSKEGLRDLVSTVICAAGTPDDGFRVSDVSPGTDTYDFDYDGGEFVLGGLHVTRPAGTFGAQPDWLDLELDAGLPSLPTGLAAGAVRSDLVYLEAWEQEISATEDSELFETALAGVDTTQRTRVMARVRVAENLADDCVDAFAELTSGFDDASYLASEALLQSTTTLQVGFTDVAPTEDLCSPSALSGFLGANNETFTLLVTEPGQFVWTNDTTTYRVQVVDDANGDPRRIQFLTHPRDAFARPVAGQTIELIPWTSLLANNEKAGAPVGRFFTIENGYDAADGVIVDVDVPQDLRDWLTAQPASRFGRFDATGDERFFLARIWTNGNGDGGSPTVAITGAVQALGQTGLTATLSSDGRRADMWRFSGRPNTPARILPWGLLDGEAPLKNPHLAPLARIVWTGQASGTPSFEIVDCRRRFRPLCRVQGCCRITVGDGRESHGDVSSIALAVERLPEEGGEICLLRGTFDEHVTITARRNITISGCGAASLWTNVEDTTPLLTLQGCEGITLRNFAMTNLSGPCIFGQDHIDDAGNVMQNVRMRCDGLIMRVGLARAINLPGGADHSVHGCTIRAGEGSPQGLGTVAAVFLKGDRLEITDNRITAEIPLRGSVQALGGVHIGSDSEDVVIAENRIAGGLGNGITLGSVRFVSSIEPEQREGAFRDAFGNAKMQNRYSPYAEVNAGYAEFPLVYGERGCIDIDKPDPDPEDPDAERPPVPVSDGPLVDVRILDNDIEDMGLNGIATYLLSILMPLFVDEPADAIAVEDVEIRKNRILRCMRNEVPQANAFLRQFIGWGGISFSLASDVTIAENRIEECGAAGAVPICGIFVALGESLVIEANRILGNGRGFVDGVSALPGRRGGIVIGLSQGGTPSSGIEQGDRRQSNRPALDCHDNEVDAPGARALKAIVLGPTHVTDNRLTGAGESSSLYQPAWRALCRRPRRAGARRRLLPAGGAARFRGLPRARADLGSGGRRCGQPHQRGRRGGRGEPLRCRERDQRGRGRTAHPPAGWRDSVQRQLCQLPGPPAAGLGLAFGGLRDVG